MNNIEPFIVASFAGILIYFAKNNKNIHTKVIIMLLLFSLLIIHFVDYMYREGASFIGIFIGILPVILFMIWIREVSHIHLVEQEKQFTLNATDKQKQDFFIKMEEVSTIENPNILQKENIFIEVCSDEIGKISEILLKGKIIIPIKDNLDENSKLELGKSFLQDFLESKVNNDKVYWAEKYNNKLSYTHLICLYYILLKEDNRNIDCIIRHIKKSKFLFETKDKNFNKVYNELNERSFRNAYNNFDINRLNTNQNEVFNKLNPFVK